MSPHLMQLDALGMLFSVNIGVFAASRLPQIWTNFQVRAVMSHINSPDTHPFASNDRPSLRGSWQ